MQENMLLLVGLGVIALVALFIFRRVVPFFKYVVIIVIIAAVMTVYKSGHWPWQ